MVKIRVSPGTILQVKLCEGVVELPVTSGEDLLYGDFSLEGFGSSKGLKHRGPSPDGLAVPTGPTSCNRKRDCLIQEENVAGEMSLSKFA